MSHELTPETDAVIPSSSHFIYWPGEEPPLAEEIRLRLSEWGPPPADGDAGSAEDTLWSLWVDLPEVKTPYLLWCEPVAGAHRVLLDTVRWQSPIQQERTLACRWVVGLEGPLSPLTPAADYRFQLQLCDAISRDWSPAIYDANAFLFRTPAEVRHLLTPKTLPRTSCLYSIHKMRSNRGSAEEKRYWLHTHGLERAGVPDLEIFNVPEKLIPAACELFEAVADLWIEFDTPDPQVPATVGAGLEVAWRPWQAVASELASEAAGGWHYRRQELGHEGYRAVLVEPAPSGWVHRRWVPPIALLERLVLTDTTLFKTIGETKRMAALARERWGDFGLLFASRPPKDWRFAVKLSYAMEDQTGHCEHLWFDVVGIKPDRIQATLVSQPAHIQTLRVGETKWHTLSRLSDWRIFTPTATYDPETAETLLEAEMSWS